jgi:multicomponent Na+:H+ antiporter subunit B
MNGTARRVLIVVFGFVLFALLACGMRGLAPFGQYPGPYGDILNASATPERHALNVVTAINFDYRGVDTLGEEFILFCSITGVLLLMRHESGSEKSGNDQPSPLHGPHEEAVDSQPSDFTKAASLVFSGIIAAFGVYVISTGHLSVGGGFQGGVITSGAWLLIFEGLGSKTFHHFSHPYIVEWFEAAGAGGYVIVGILPLFCAKNFLTNILPLGRPGDLISSGTILLINWMVGVEVAAGFVLLLKEFLRPLEKVKPLRDP